MTRVKAQHSVDLKTLERETTVRVNALAKAQYDMDLRRALQAAEAAEAALKVDARHRPDAALQAAVQAAVHDAVAAATAAALDASLDLVAVAIEAVETDAMDKLEAMRTSLGEMRDRLTVQAHHASVVESEHAAALAAREAESANLRAERNIAVARVRAERDNEVARVRNERNDEVARLLAECTAARKQGVPNIQELLQRAAAEWASIGWQQEANDLAGESL